MRDLYWQVPSPKLTPLCEAERAELDAWLLEHGESLPVPVQVALAQQVGAGVELDDVNRWLEKQPANRCAALVAIDLADDPSHFLPGLEGALSTIGFRIDIEAELCRESFKIS